eukprot:m.140986 g.140986  ORF g.140986 m.140986 type:complete len:55 (-) comp35456_c0_seq1:376-540(-)
MAMMDAVFALKEVEEHKQLAMKALALNKFDACLNHVHRVRELLDSVDRNDTRLR